jgi:thiol-disulfide isomerase/thioredoxin
VQLQEARDDFIVSLTEDHPDLYASRIIDSYRAVILQPGLKGTERIAFLREHFFEFAPIDNPMLLHAPVYTGKIIEYLRLYRGQDHTFSEQEDAFIYEVDMIMANVSGDPDLRAFAVEYMLEGFESFGMEQVQTYIVDTYVDETCTTDVVELAVERVKGYRKMAEGQTGADILVRNVDNQVVRLSEVDAKYTLLVFWATYCEHCREMIPEIHEWYETERPQNVEVFAVSIDTIKSDWVNYIRTVQPPWIDGHEPMGWEGQSAEDYNIYATPTMFLLDSDLTIVARPFNVRELRRTVRKLSKQ